MKIYGVIGRKNNGKTTLVERLVSEIAGRGFSVSTVKHAHPGFEIDHEGRDSHRHRMAGASEVLVASRTRWALIHELRGEEEPALDALLARMSPCDLVLVEGYGRDTHPKIEVYRAGEGKPLLAAEDPTVRLVVADEPLETALPQLSSGDVAGIAGFILAETGLA